MVKKILLLSGFALGGIVSAGDPESSIRDNMSNLRGRLSELRNNDDVDLKNQIQSDFDTACSYLEKVKDKLPEKRYMIHYTWLHKEFVPAFKSLSTKTKGDPESLVSLNLSIRKLNRLARISSISQQKIDRQYTKVSQSLDDAVFSGSLDQDQYRAYCVTIYDLKTKLDSRFFDSSIKSE
jgi:hypothetical protein